MSEARPPWQNLFARIRVVRDGSKVYAPPPTDAELDALETEIGSPLPASYRAFMLRFGAGEYRHWVLLDPVTPAAGRATSFVSESTARLREFCVDFCDHLPNHAWLSTLICFGSSGGGDWYTWDPAAITRRKPREHAFYFLRLREANEPVPAGDSFWQFIEWVEADMNSWPRRDEDEDDTLAFNPYSIRDKAKLLRRDVKPWLAWNDGIVRKIALALQADPRADEFPVLADALRDAGCDHTDLLDSCRRDAHDEDRAWVLKILLGARARQ